MHDTKYQEEEINGELRESKYSMTENECKGEKNKDKIEKKIKNVNEKRSALLTLMFQLNSYYEQYTIYPRHEKKSKATDTNLYQMVKVQKLPLNSRAKYLELNFFSCLFSYGKNGQNETRSTSISDFFCIKHMLLSKHLQFQTDMLFLLYLLCDHNRRQLNAGIFSNLNITNAHVKYTAETYLSKLSNLELESDLTTIFSRLRNTAEYWN